MKKILCFILSVCLLFAAASCGSAEAESPSVSSAPSTAVMPSAPASPSPAQTEASAVSAPSDAELAILLPFLDSIILCQQENSYPSHDSSNAEYVWSLLFYYCVNYFNQIPFAVQNSDGTVSVPADDLAAFASVFFSDLKKLPSLPGSASISYDQDADAYVFLLADRSQTETGIVDVKTDSESGLIQITAELRSTIPDESDYVIPYLFSIVRTDSSDFPLAVNRAAAQ